MSDMYPCLVTAIDSNKGGEDGASLIEALAESLRGCGVRLQTTKAAGTTASASEGLALVQSFVAIRDPAVRQAILDVVATLAGK